MGTGLERSTRERDGTEQDDSSWAQLSLVLQSILKAQCEEKLKPSSVLASELLAQSLLPGGRNRVAKSGETLPWRCNEW